MQVLKPFPSYRRFLTPLQLFENIVTKEEIAQNTMFPLLVIGYSFNYRDLPFFDKICSKSSAAELSYEGSLGLTLSDKQQL